MFLFTFVRIGVCLASGHFHWDAAKRLVILCCHSLVDLFAICCLTNMSVTAQWIMCVSDLEMYQVTSDCLYVWLGKESSSIRLFECLSGKFISLHQIVSMSDFENRSSFITLFVCLTWKCVMLHQIVCMSGWEVCRVTSDYLYVWLENVSGCIRLFVCLTGKCIRLQIIYCYVWIVFIHYWQNASG